MGACSQVDETGANAQFLYGSTIVDVSSDGDTVVVADELYDHLRLVNPSTKVVTTLAGVGQRLSGTTPAGYNSDGVGTSAVLHLIKDIAMSYDAKTVYVATIGLVRTVDVSSGNVTTLVGAGESGGQYNGGCAAGKTDAEMNKWFDGTGTNARFLKLAAISVTSDASAAYVVDLNAVRKIDIANRAVTTIVGTPCICDCGSQMDERVVDGTGTHAVFLAASALVVTADGDRVFVADRYTVRQVELATKVVTTIAGFKTPGLHPDYVVTPPQSRSSNGAVYERYQAARGGSGNVYRDGVGTDAIFSGLTSLTATADGGTLYVADYLNRAIRKVDVATGTVTTAAGYSPMSTGNTHLTNSYKNQRFIGRNGYAAFSTFNHPTGLAMGLDPNKVYIMADKQQGLPALRLLLPTGLTTPPTPPSQPPPPNPPSAPPSLPPPLLPPASPPPIPPLHHHHHHPPPHLHRCLPEPLSSSWSISH